jgi:hypothetical protein
LLSMNVFQKRAVYEIMWKNMVEADHRWQYNTVHALCMLGT